ncbi:MAG: ABC transporter permease [Eubacteriales bacterium]|nr:ABC transporter permease [Eubacteriales bacterium]
MILQSVKMAWASVISNKMRSFLTMLGIIIGVMALVVLVSIADGATNEVTDAISSMGTNLLTVTISDDGGNPVRLSEMDDILALDDVSEAAPVGTDSLTLSSGEESETGSVTGTTADYLDIEGLELSAGRWLNSSDVDSNTRVVIINQDTAYDILGVTFTTDAIDQTIDIAGIPYTVVGVLAEDDSVTSSASSYEVYIPYTSLERISSTVSDVTSFVVAASDDSRLDAAEKSVETWLYDRFGDEDAYDVTNMSEVADTMDSVTNTMALMLGGIAAISLLVGGIGIMNIMLVSVTERTREIGIRKAIGAGAGSILAQFLIESLMLSLMGDALGVASSWIALRIIAAVTGSSYAMDGKVVLAATAFSLVIGVVFGLYPARKAAKKNPIDALHFSG